MATLYTADLHFGHRNIIRYCDRPFADVDEMDAELVRRWNEVVGADDTVWVLGDVALGEIERSLSMIGRLNGTKRLVSGNHDRCWSGNKKVGEWPERYLAAGFATVSEEERTTLPGVAMPVVLSHFPYQGDSHDGDRYEAHRPKDEGLWVVHGHVHGAWKVKGRQVNVGVDVWDYAPVTEEQVAEVIRSAA